MNYINGINGPRNSMQNNLIWSVRNKIKQTVSFHLIRLKLTHLLNPCHQVDLEIQTD